MAKQRKQRILYTVGDIRDFLLAEKWQREIPQSVVPSKRSRPERHTYPQRESSVAQQRLPIGWNADGSAKW